MCSVSRRKKAKKCRFYYFKSIELGLSLRRSSHRRCSVRKCFLRNFAKFSGKHLHQRLFFSKFAGLSPQLYLKRVNSTPTQLFSCEFCKICNNTFFTKHLLETASGVSFIRSSHPVVFCKITVLENFSKFTGKHLCQSLFFLMKLIIIGPSLEFY